MRPRFRKISPHTLTVQKDSLDVKAMIDAYVKNGTLPPVGQAMEGSYDFEGSVDGSRPDFDIDSVETHEFVDKIDQHIFMKNRKQEFLNDLNSKKKTVQNPDTDPEPPGEPAPEPDPADGQ